MLQSLPLPPAPATISDSRNKRGPFALVTFSARLDRPSFDRALRSARSAGGWYSRAWNGAPGGFGFASRDLAAAWLESLAGGAL